MVNIRYEYIYGKKEYLTIPQAARILGISRIAVYKKVKKGQIKAERIGRIYAISQKKLFGNIHKKLTKKRQTAA